MKDPNYIHSHISNENMLLVNDLIAAIEEGEDGAHKVRYLLDDGGRKFESFRKQLHSLDFGEVYSTTNWFKLISLWAAVDGEDQLLKVLLPKLEDDFPKWEFAAKCFDISCRFDQVKCVEVSFFETGNEKVDELRVKYEQPLIYATERNRKELVRFLLKVGANPLIMWGCKTPIEIAKNLKDKDIYFMLTRAAEGRNKLGLKFRLFAREMKWPHL